MPLALKGGERRVDSCIVVTGSHNPPDYNGFKMVLRGAAIYGEQIQALYRRIVDERFEAGSGSYEAFGRYDQYIERIVGDEARAPDGAVVDAGNGVAGPLATRLFKALGCTCGWSSALPTSMARSGITTLIRPPETCRT